MYQLILDLAPIRHSFEVNCAKADGTPVDPTGTPTVTIYEEGGADGTYDSGQIAGSPFTIAKINAVTGNYGILVLKNLFTVGKIYRALFQCIVDGISAKITDRYLAIEAPQFKANVTNLDAAVSSRSSHTAAQVWAAGGRTLTTPGDYKATVSALALEANVQAHAAAALTADAKLEFIKQINGGRWKIVGNQMIFYKEDNTTVVATFNLFDQNGNPSMVNVFDRQKV